MAQLKFTTAFCHTINKCNIHLTLFSLFRAPDTDNVTDGIPEEFTDGSTEPDAVVIPSVNVSDRPLSITTLPGQQPSDSNECRTGVDKSTATEEAYVRVAVVADKSMPHPYAKLCFDGGNDEVNENTCGCYLYSSHS